MQRRAIRASGKWTKTSPPAPTEPRDLSSQRPSRYGRWRAATLVGVYVRFAHSFYRTQNPKASHANNAYAPRLGAPWSRIGVHPRLMSGGHGGENVHAAPDEVRRAQPLTRSAETVGTDLVSIDLSRASSGANLASQDVAFVLRAAKMLLGGARVHRAAVGLRCSGESTPDVRAVRAHC